MSQTYRLVLEIDADSSLALAGEDRRVVLAQPAGNAQPNVAWLALPPISLTTVEWTATRGLYAAEAALRNGAAIVARWLVHPAVDGTAYAFSGASFDMLRDAGRIPRGHYDVVNDTPNAVVFGLLQDATVNGKTVRSPVNAVVLPPAFRADFAVPARVYVWTQRAIATGCIAPAVPADAALVVFERALVAKRCVYERATGAFALR